MKELSKLQDEVPAASFNQVKPIIEKEIGDINQKFDSLNTDAISGASLGQVYLAKIDGQEVVVKVKRPGIEKSVATHIKVLKKIVPIGLKLVDPNLAFSARGLLSQFIDTIHEEMDYSMELENLKKIKNNLKNNDRVIIPSVYDDYSSKNVITMEHISGTKITDIEGLENKGIDREMLLKDVYRIFFTMLLKYSIFHADPHPGNISVNDEGKVILYDYGMVGRVDDDTRVRLVRLYLALIEKDPSRTVNVMDELNMLTPNFNRTVIEKAIMLSIKSMHGKKVDDMEVKAIMELANITMGKFPFLLPKQLALFLRMSSIMEGIYDTHNVKIKFAKVFKRILEEENLIYEAYIGEIKNSFNKFQKSIDAVITLAPDLKKFLDNSNSIQLKSKQKRNTLLPGSILSAAIFVGSVFLFSTNELAGIIGMVSSGIVMGIFAKFAKT